MNNMNKVIVVILIALSLTACKCGKQDNASPDDETARQQAHDLWETYKD